MIWISYNYTSHFLDLHISTYLWSLNRCSCLLCWINLTQISRLSETSSQRGEIMIALKAVNCGPVDTDMLYAVVMATEAFDEQMLATTYDHLVYDELAGRFFRAKNAKLWKFWLRELFQQKWWSLNFVKHYETMLMVVLWLYIREQCVFWINLDGSSVLDGYVLNQDGNGIMVV